VAVADRGSPKETDAPQPRDAADAALELLKQLITLSSGMIAVSAAFADKFLSGHAVDWLLPTSWFLLAVSVVSALVGISAIIKSHLRPEFPWHEGVGRTSTWVSRSAFVLGVLCFGAFAFAEERIATRPKHDPPKAVAVRIFSRDQKEYAIVDSALILLPGEK
jgi:hypothetical protein